MRTGRRAAVHAVKDHVRAAKPQFDDEYRGTHIIYVITAQPLLTEPCQGCPRMD